MNFEKDIDRCGDGFEAAHKVDDLLFHGDDDFDEFEEECFDVFLEDRVVGISNEL